MIRALYSSATGMKAQEILLDVTANNIANVNTNGFKRSHVNFADMMYTSLRPSGQANLGPPVPLQIGSGTRATDTTKQFSPGTPQLTGGDTDLMIDGDGFFRVQLPSGELRYTRDGAFHRNANGLLVNADGYQLADGITIPSDATKIEISPQGVVSYQPATGGATRTDAGTIQLAAFANPAGLSSNGGNLYSETAASGTALLTAPGTIGAPMLLHKWLEQSNVEVVTELVSLITAQRAYEVNARAIRAGDEMLSTTNQIIR